jgi:hypothetical protein
LDRPLMSLRRASAISSALVGSPLPLRKGAVFFATSFGCAENCLPFLVSARFLAVVRL